MNDKNVLEIHADGASRGQGKDRVASFGFVVESNGETLEEKYSILDEGEDATNNYAEYKAVILALQWVKESDIKPDKIDVKSDSQLIIRQINGEWSVKSGNLRELYKTARDLVEHFQDMDVTITLEHVPREENERADELSQLALEDHFLARELKDDDKKRCPECGEDLVVREGKYGKFYGCEGYPDCDYTEDYEEEQ